MLNQVSFLRHASVYKKMQMQGCGMSVSEQVLESEATGNKKENQESVADKP
jgi:hypothetical protein